MKIYKNRWFAKFARKERISDAKLCEAIRQADQGLIDSDYGGGVIKKRISRKNQGKSGGYRTIILFRKGHRSFFIYGFPKNDLGNIDESDVRDFKELAHIHLTMSEDELAILIASGRYEEVKDDDKGAELQE